MSCDFQLQAKTTLLYILPTDVSCNGGPDTFTRRALPLETRVYTFALPVTWHRPKGQSTTHDSSCDLHLSLFCFM